MIFVDTWAWIGLAVKKDQYHQAALAKHKILQQQGRRYVTSDFVLSELITFLYRVAPAAKAESFIDSILRAANDGTYVLVHLSIAQFEKAWSLRRKYRDKPDISFVDFTTAVVMQDMGIQEVFTGDAHFLHLGLGFQIVH